MDAKYGVTWSFMDMTLYGFNQYQPHVVLSTTYAPAHRKYASESKVPTKAKRKILLRIINVLSTIVPLLKEKTRQTMSKVIEEHEE